MPQVVDHFPSKTQTRNTGPKRRRYTGACILGLLFLTLGAPGLLPVQAQTKEQIDQIIQSFAAKEKKFKEAWLKYSYEQSMELRVVAVNGRPRRELFRMDSEVVFDDKGNRKIEITNQVDRLSSLRITREDIDVIHNLQPFVLTSDDLDQYKIEFLRKERVDEIDTYVFHVKPRHKRKGHFYFKGDIWVDDIDLQIVMSRGKTVPEPRGQKFPEFETRRELIDNKFWFPTWTEAKDTLRFSNGNNVDIHEIVTYDHYKRFDVDATIRYDTKIPPE